VAVACLGAAAARPAPLVLGLALVLLFSIPWGSPSGTAWPTMPTRSARTPTITGFPSGPAGDWAAIAGTQQILKPVLVPV
jgi:hypothetical protein